MPKRAWLLFVAGSLAAAGGVGYVLGSRQATHSTSNVKSHAVKSAHPLADPESAEQKGVRLLASGELLISDAAIQSLGVRVTPVVEAPATEPLKLSGLLFLDSSQFAMVHTRFVGEIVRVGEIDESKGDSVVTRQVRPGDFVSKGDVLAVIWSKEIGEKKSDLVEALSRCKASKATLERLEALEHGVVAGQIVRDARRQHESDLIAVDRAERTLRSWKETEAEIAEVYAEADLITRGDNAKSSRVRETWANVEIRSPLDGVILERNISLGEIVDTNCDMFKVANVNRLGVLANVYEDDLPKLTRLPKSMRRWELKLKADPMADLISGEFEVIGHVIHPDQHTAAIVGWIDNPEQRLRTGQFVTASINVPGPDNALLVPNSAVIDAGNSTLIFVAQDPSAKSVKARSVEVIRRGREFALIRKLPARGSLQEGELVVTSGNLELYGVLQDQISITDAN